MSKRRFLARTRMIEVSMIAVWLWGVPLPSVSQFMVGLAVITYIYIYMGINVLSLHQPWIHFNMGYKEHYKDVNHLEEAFCSDAQITPNLSYKVQWLGCPAVATIMRQASWQSWNRRCHAG